ncbi:hypothetical protein ACP4OV_004225 [Aristida adscensionis]
MQQQHQGGGGSPYGAPPPQDMGPFSPAAASGPMPLSSRPPPAQQQQQPPPPRPSYEELAAVSGAGAFQDDEMLGDAGGGSGGGGGGGGGSGASGNRWPREETLALIRIRSEMDATFRDATLKGPLWEDVSRKLADLGYKRSAKKCKEKFENVHKYYKRTKEGRAGRQDGKSYRFFSELEALHAAAPQPQQLQLPPNSSPAPPMHAYAAPVSAPLQLPPPQQMSTMPPPTGPMQPAPISSAAPAAPAELTPAQPLNLQGLSFSSMSDSESDDESDEDDDMTAETGGSQSQDRLGKRKRGGGKKLMSFFEGLMKQVVERQEEMQRRFLETMEKREAERTAREEAWRRQEVARLNREQEQLAQERAAAASRDAAIIAFLQRIGGQSVQPPPAVAVAIHKATPVQAHTPPPAKQPPRQQPPPPPPPPAAQATPQPKPIQASPLQQQPPQPQHNETTHNDAVTPRSTSLELVPVPEHHADAGLGGADGGAASSSRWPKTEVHALIQLRMEMDTRYTETGPKGPLWEEISSGMRRLGYNRSSKRCKEKWENINKYYKKVKESNKRRPEDSKTCPYFHQLEAIYRKKHLAGGSSAAPAANAVAAAPAAALPEPPQQQPNRFEIEGKNINDDKRKNGGSGGGGPHPQVPTSNGETTPTTAAAFDADHGGVRKVTAPCAPTSSVPVAFSGSIDQCKLTRCVIAVKPEDIVRELNEQPPREITTDETDSDDMGDEYTDDGEDGEDDGKMQYRIQFQRTNPGGTNSAPPAPATTTAAPAVPTSAPTSTFLAMVQ